MPVKSSNKLDDFPEFSGADLEMIKALENKLEQYLGNIVAVLGIKATNEIFCDQEIFFDVVTRVEMRRIYFHVFHKGMEMGELNEGCLLCFWILKFMPFSHDRLSNVVLNVKIAACIFLNMLRYVATKEGKTVNIRGDTVGDLMYAFRYRDLSKEALMILAKSLLCSKA
jgi:hypothetical protein